MQRKVPLPGKIFARCILRRRFAGHFGCMARTSCQSQLVLDAWRAYLARKGRFSRPRPLSGCMGRKNCHGLPPGNAPRKNIATASQAKNALRRNPATAGRWETHLASILPSASARERIRAQSCHRQAPGNTSMKNLHNRHLTIVYKSLTRNQAEYNKEIGF